jgi:hypothetical protein
MVCRRKKNCNEREKRADKKRKDSSKTLMEIKLTTTTKVDEGNGTEYNKVLQNNLDENKGKRLHRKEAYLKRGVSYNKKFHVEKAIRRNLVMIAFILMNGILTIV